MQIRDLTDEEWLSVPKEEILQLYKNCHSMLMGNIEQKKKCKVFKIDISGDYQYTYVHLNFIKVYQNKNSRECYMFAAELKARIIMAGGVIDDK